MTMKKVAKSTGGEAAPQSDDPVAAYAKELPHTLQTMCGLLRELIDESLPKATSKIWHGSPVWFIGDNPVVGYNATKTTVKLLFWNGQAFDEAGLKAVGKNRAAQAVFTDAAQLNTGGHSSLAEQIRVRCVRLEVVL
jgi:hypothetical protein